MAAHVATCTESFDGKIYLPGETVPDFGTIRNTGGNVYRGNAADFAAFQAATTTTRQYADLPTGAMFISSDFSTIKTYQEVTRSWVDMA